MNHPIISIFRSFFQLNGKIFVQKLASLKTNLNLWGVSKQWLDYWLLKQQLSDIPFFELSILWITKHSNSLINPDQQVIYTLTYPNRTVMKAISTFVSLSLIVITCAISAVLYLNENYGFSALLCIVWIISLTFWIGKSSGILQVLIHSKRIPLKA